MLVSIIIPSYNYGGYISQTLGSLVAQSYPQWEAIVVDDGSTDDTRDVVTKYRKTQPRIKYLYQENGGQAAARNSGLRAAKGAYIQFLDADDLLEPMKLERHIEFLCEHDAVDIVYGESRFFRSEHPDERRYTLRGPDERWMPKISGSGMDLIHAFIKTNIFTVSAPLTRRTVIDRVGDFDIGLNPVEDWDYWMRCAIAGASMKYLDADGSRDLIRIHSLSSNQDMSTVRRKHVLVRMKFDEILPEGSLRDANHPFLKTSEMSRIAGECIIGLREMARRDLAKGVRRTWAAFRSNPSVFLELAVRTVREPVRSYRLGQTLNY